jgi:hypothetical protein
VGTRASSPAGSGKSSFRVLVQGSTCMALARSSKWVSYRQDYCWHIRGMDYWCYPNRWAAHPLRGSGSWSTADYQKFGERRGPGADGHPRWRAMDPPVSAGQRHWLVGRTLLSILVVIPTVLTDPPSAYRPRLRPSEDSHRHRPLTGAGPSHLSPSPRPCRGAAFSPPAPAGLPLVGWGSLSAVAEAVAGPRGRSVRSPGGDPHPPSNGAVPFSFRGPCDCAPGWREFFADCRRRSSME